MYAVFPKSDARKMIPLSECILVEHEYQAQWQCILNPELTYKEIEHKK